MSHDLIPNDPQQQLAQAGQAADQIAAIYVFQDFRDRKSANTLAAHDGDLQAFHDFLLAAVGVAPDNLNTDPQSWQGITHGLVAAFVRYLAQEGYAIGTINRRLSTVKKYAQLAFQAGVLSAEAHALIRTVTGYTNKEGKKLNEKRQQAGVETRRSDDVGRVEKKAEHTRLNADDVRILKRCHGHSPQAKRDALLMALLLDLGLRASEVSGITVGNVDMIARQLRFYRPKVDKTQTHNLTRDAYLALEAYLPYAPLMQDAPLLRASKRDGDLTAAGLTPRSISRIVRKLGKQHLGLHKLSAHDCRHSWATRAAQSGTDAFALQEAGGWNSLAMPRRYVEDASIANEGVKLE